MHWCYCHLFMRAETVLYSSFHLLITMVYKPSKFLKNKWIDPCNFHYNFGFDDPIIFISWRLITLQYCSGFCHTMTWISHGFTCIPHPDPPSHLPVYPIPLGLPSAPGPTLFKENVPVRANFHISSYSFWKYQVPWSCFSWGSSNKWLDLIFFLSRWWV